MEVRSPIEVEIPSHGVAVLESRHRADFFMPWRIDTYAKVLYVLGGHGRFCLDGREMELKAQHLCLVPPGCRHRLVDERGQPVRLLGLCLDVENPAWENVAASLFETPGVMGNPALVQESAAALKRLLFEQSSAKSGWREMQIAGCGMLLVQLLRGRGEAAERTAVDRVRWYVEEMSSSFYLNEQIDEVAERVGLSRRRFTQLFREVTGETWLQRLQSLRIKHACRILRDTNRSTKAIAFECGFESLPQFFRTFKRLKEMTPGEWRATRCH